MKGKKIFAILLIMIGMTVCMLTISASLTPDILRQPNTPFHTPPQYVSLQRNGKISQTPENTMLPQWLSISKDDGIGVHGFVYPGDPFQYNITYSNPTLLTVHNVSVIDHLDTKVDYISSIPTGYYISQFHQVYWNFSSLNPGQGGTIKLLVHAKNGTAGTIVHNNVTIYSTETLPTNASHTTLIWEGNKPVTSIHIGQPRYTPGDWITSHTPIWLNATDDFAGVKEIHYRINGIEHIAAGNTTMFYVITDCQAALQYWAIDYFNNIETTHNKTFFVDDTPPIIAVETGEPSYEGFIGRNTPVWFNATDQGCDGGVGLKNLTYTVYHKIGSSWVYQYGSTVVDNDQNDTDPTRGTISVEFHFNDTGQHQIRYCAYDLLGNRQPNSGYQTQDFYVDADGPVMTCNFGDPKNNYFRSQNGQWYVGIGSTTPVILHADDGTGVGADALYFSLYTTDTYGEWVYHYSGVVYDNGWNDYDPAEGSITTYLYMDENCWHQLHYWAFDKLENRNPLNESSYEQTEFLVDANAPTTTWTYTNPHYQDPVDHFMWITNQTKKQVTVMDTGCNPQGSGVSLVNWRVAKNINGSWMEVKRGTVHDNDINDTDGSPAHPVQGQSGGIWGIDSENRAYVFQDTNHNNTYDIGEPILSYDPDKDGFLAVPHRGDQGGLFALDSFQQPFIFQDTNNDFIYTNGDNIISYDPNHDAIPAQPQEGIVGGLYTFDDQSRPYTFAEFNGNWVVISSKPFGTGVGTINMSINISSDGEYHIYHQAIDTLGNMGPEYKEYVRVDDTPPVTINITGTPQYYRDTIFYITNQTPITIKTADQTPPCAVGVKYFHYEIWANNTKTFQKNVTLFDEETFTIQGEGSHEVRWYAEDILGNREKTHYQTYCVDDTPPVVIITHGDPLIPMQNYSWVNKSTSITVDAQNPGYCPFFTIKFRINRGVWHNITNQHPFTLTFSDECIYELDAMAWDVLNHIDRKIQLYYVDNTPPQISIIKPVNGWYTTGSPIAAIIPAIDQPNNNTPCDDELAVGISAGNPADAFLLDAFPSFQYILLDGSTCVYDSTQGKFLGNFIVPQNIPFGNGPVLFGTLISDDLGNVNNTLSKLHELFLQAAGDENVFNTLIQPLQNTHQIVYVGIDRTPPSVTIAQPQQGAMIGPNPVDITAYMQDDLSGIDAGTPCYVTLQGIPLGTLQYNPTIGGCAGTLPLPGNIDSGTDIPFTVTVSDIAGNIGQATILVNVTSSHTNTPPVGVIISPVEGKTYNHTLSVEVEAHDAETPTEDLQVVVEIDRQNDPPFTYTAAYSTIFKNFTVDIDITNYTNTSTLQVLAYVTDGSGSTVITPPVHCSVKSNITYDKWMTVGWNLVNLPSIGTNTSIPHVFRSILGDFNYVFDSSTWDNYKYGRPINTLTNTQAGVWYWVNMINATRFYLTETG